MNNVIFPFGPPIYINQVDENILKELDARIEETGGKPEFDASGQLAGRIKKQTHLDKVISESVKEDIFNIVQCSMNRQLMVKNCLCRQ